MEKGIWPTEWLGFPTVLFFLRSVPDLGFFVPRGLLVLGVGPIPRFCQQTVLEHRSNRKMNRFGSELREANKFFLELQEHVFFKYVNPMKARSKKTLRGWDELVEELVIVARAAPQ